jgi:selenide,water dikinase
MPPDMPETQRHLLTDPQTSGGLLIALAPEHAQSILRTIREAGYPAACIIGHAEEGNPAIKVECRI